MKRELKIIIIGFSSLLIMALVTILVLVAIGFSNENKETRRSKGPKVEVTETVTSTELSVATNAEIESLSRALTIKISGLEIEAVHQLIRDRVLELVKGKRLWDEGELIAVLASAVDAGIITWLDGVIVAEANKLQFSLSAAQRLELRSYFYHSDWLLFMSYYEIAFLQGEGITVSE